MLELTLQEIESCFGAAGVSNPYSPGEVIDQYNPFRGATTETVAEAVKSVLSGAADSVRWSMVGNAVVELAKEMDPTKISVVAKAWNLIKEGYEGKDSTYENRLRDTFEEMRHRGYTEEEIKRLDEAARKNLKK